MKELSIEQKAQRYDEALEKAKQFHDGDLFAECNGNLVEYIFPELKESDDEKIRKTISDILLIDSDEIREILEANNLFMQDINAWLEKQMEPTDHNSIDPHFGKPVDKVEPKFHEGEWVTIKE